jgi:hypothetical protein
MGFYSHATFGESVVALAALLPVVAAIAGLGITGCLDRMDGDEIAPVAAWCKVATRAFSFEVSADPAPLVTVEAPGLIVAFAAFGHRLAGNGAMISDPVTVMIGSDTFTFMTCVALTKR